MDNRILAGSIALTIGLVTAILVTVCSKNILDNFKKPVLLCLFQSGLSAVYLIPFYCSNHSKICEEDSTVKRRHLFLLTGLWAGGQLGMTGALTLLSAPTTNAIASLQSLMTLAFSWLLLERRDSPGGGSYRRLILPSVLSTAGVLLIVYLESSTTTTPILPDDKTDARVAAIVAATVAPPLTPPAPDNTGVIAPIIIGDEGIKGHSPLRLLQPDIEPEETSANINIVPIGVHIPVNQEIRLDKPSRNAMVIRETVTIHSVAKTILGSLLALGAAASSALFSVYTARLFSRKRTAKQHKTTIMSEVTGAMKLYGYMGAIILAAAPITLLLADITGFEDFQFFPQNIIPKLLALTLGGNVLGAVSWCIGNILLNPVLSGVCTCLIVPGTLLCDIIFNGKHFDKPYYVAMSMVFIGATWVALASAKGSPDKVATVDESTALV